VFIFPGDAYVANALQTPDGARWVDWELSHIGCPAEDLAVLTSTMNVSTPEQAKLVLSEYGYGDSRNEKLLIWFYKLKRSAIALYYMEVLAPPETPAEFKVGARKQIDALLAAKP
jgi:aminoglycoside phosphotransferase (APT) family kinase protein